jgi:hypothetical protein
MATRAKNRAKATNTAKAKAKAITSLAVFGGDRGPGPRALCAGTVLCGAALVGLAGAVVALQGRGGEQALRARQSRSLGMTSAATTLAAGKVQAFVARAPEPVRAGRRTGPVESRCRPGGAGPLRNPWSCQVRYRSGGVARYRVVVRPDGYYRGVGSGIIEGCCIAVPTLN